MENFARHDNSKIMEGENEYQWLNRKMETFFKEHIDTQRLLKNSRKTLKTYYLSRLMMEHCEKNPQEQSGIHLYSEYFAVVLFKPEPQGELTAERMGEEAQTLRKFIIANVFEEISQQYFEIEMTEMGEQEAAIVGMKESSDQNMEQLQECIENLQQITEESFSFTCIALMGMASEGIGGIHESYIQAQGMEEYVSLLDTSIIRYDKVKDLYSPLGAPSIDPVVLIKIVLIQYLFGIPSMRQTIREIEVNVAYRWFLGYSLTEKIPHFSTFNKNYERRFKNTDLFESIFKEILARATKCGFVDSSNIYIDSTHIKASANKKKYTKVEVDIQAKHYQEKLEKEINEDRLKHGKSPLSEAKNEEVKKRKK